MKQKKRKSMKPTYILAYFLVTLLFSIVIGSFVFERNAKASFADPFISSSQGEVGEDLPQIDIWVDEYANRYSKTRSEVNHAKQLLHCLLYREAGYGSNKGHGDNGKAGGPLQFWNETWNRMRNKMIKQGLTNEVGSRYDMEQSISTTAWAIVSGYSKEWGPYARGECK